MVAVYPCCRHCDRESEHHRPGPAGHSEPCATSVRCAGAWPVEVLDLEDDNQHD